MTREEVKVEFNGLTHDHLMVNKRDVRHPSSPLVSDSFASPGAANSDQENMLDDDNNAPSSTSTIAILRRLAMYDSLVLVKRYRECINGYTLEFPTSNLSSRKTSSSSSSASSNDDDRKQQSQQHEQQDCRQTKLVSMYLDGDDPIYQNRENKRKQCLCTPDEGEIVYVPMNGLMARLDNYDRHGVSIDSRVYAFAMGLKTAEIFLTASSEKEIQETPAL